MNSNRLAQALVLVALAATGGCATDKALHGVNTSVSDGIYKAPNSVALPNDIKEILVAGGLDTHNPSAPTAGTKMAEMANGKAGKPKEVAQLVARLESSAPTSTPSPVSGGNAAHEIAESREQATKPMLLALNAPRKDKMPVLSTASVIGTKPHDSAASAASSEEQVASIEHEVTSVTFTYPDIGVAAQKPSETLAFQSSAVPLPKTAPKQDRIASSMPNKESPNKPRRF